MVFSRYPNFESGLPMTAGAEKIRLAKHEFTGIQSTIVSMGAVIVAEVIDGEACLPYASGYRMLAHSAVEEDPIFDRLMDWWRKANGFKLIPVQEKLKPSLALSNIYLNTKTTHLVVPDSQFWTGKWPKGSLYVDLKTAIYSLLNSNS